MSTPWMVLGLEKCLMLKWKDFIVWECSNHCQISKNVDDLGCVYLECTDFGSKTN